MKTKIYIIIGLLLIGCRVSVAQYDAQIANYRVAMNYYNPAFAGKSGELEAVALQRLQWVGVGGAPKTTFVSGNMPFKFLGRTHGVGAVVINETEGLFKHSVMAGQYAYKKNIWKGTLSVGIQGGMIDNSFNADDVELDPGKDDAHEETDEDFPTSGKISGKAFDLNIGVLFSKKNWYAGFSATHLLSPEISMGENHITKLPRGYYLMGGYNIQLNNPLLELQPSGLFKSSALIPGLDSTAMIMQLDLSVLMVYNKTFFGGLGWRASYAELMQSASAFVMLGGRFKSFEAGYAFDFPTSAINKVSTGSHELYLKYVIDLNLGKGDKNKHKSVRIL